MLFGLRASCIWVSKSDRSYTAWFAGFASVAPVRIETCTRELFTSEIFQHFVEQSPASCSNARLRRDFLTTQICSSGLLASDSHPPCRSLSPTLLIAASQRLSSCNLVIKPKDMRIVTFLTEVSHCSVLLTSQRSLVLLTLVHTLSDVLDGFLLRLLGISQALSLLCRFSVRFVRSPRSPCSSARLSVLSALCCFLQRHILHNLVCVGPPSFTWFEHSHRRLRLQRSFTLALRGPCLVDHGLPDALTASFIVQSYLSVHLRCAAYVSRVSACWLHS